MTRRGTALTTLLTIAAAAGALAFAGLTTFGGKSVCSLMACDGAKSATTTAASDVHTCPFHDQIAAHKSACSGSCAGKGACGSQCDGAAFVTMDASFPLAIPAAFHDETPVCPSTLVKASNATCSKSASACCSSGAKAQTIAASNETKSASGCCPLGALKAQTVAASNTTTACSGDKAACAGKAACSGKASCDPAACAAKGCDPSQCSGSGSCSASFVTMQASFPVAIPAAFNDQKQVCPSTLVKAAKCESELSAAANAGCPFAAAQIEAASVKTEATDSGCCQGSGVRADGKPCCGKCDKDKAANTEANTAEPAKSEG